MYVCMYVCMYGCIYTVTDTNKPVDSWHAIQPPDCNHNSTDQSSTTIFGLSFLIPWNMSKHSHDELIGAKGSSSKKKRKQSKSHVESTPLHEQQQIRADSSTSAAAADHGQMTLQWEAKPTAPSVACTDLATTTGEDNPLTLVDVNKRLFMAEHLGNTAAGQMLQQHIIEEENEEENPVGYVNRALERKQDPNWSLYDMYSKGRSLYWGHVASKPFRWTFAKSAASGNVMEYPETFDGTRWNRVYQIWSPFFAVHKAFVSDSGTINQPDFHRQMPHVYATDESKENPTKNYLKLVASFRPVFKPPEQDQESDSKEDGPANGNVPRNWLRECTRNTEMVKLKLWVEQIVIPAYLLARVELAMSPERQEELSIKDDLTPKIKAAIKNATKRMSTAPTAQDVLGFLRERAQEDDIPLIKSPFFVMDKVGAETARRRCGVDFHRRLAYELKPDQLAAGAANAPPGYLDDFQKEQWQNGIDYKKIKHVGRKTAPSVDAGDITAVSFVLKMYKKVDEPKIRLEGPFSMLHSGSQIPLMQTVADDADFVPDPEMFPDFNAE